MNLISQKDKKKEADFLVLILLTKLIQSWGELYYWYTHYVTNKFEF